jgi:hypothetical protein
VLVGVAVGVSVGIGVVVGVGVSVGSGVAVGSGVGGIVLVAVAEGDAEGITGAGEVSRLGVETGDDATEGVTVVARA